MVSGYLGLPGYVLARVLSTCQMFLARVASLSPLSVKTCCTGRRTGVQGGTFRYTTETQAQVVNVVNVVYALLLRKSQFPAPIPVPSGPMPIKGPLALRRTVR